MSIPDASSEFFFVERHRNNGPHADGGTILTCCLARFAMADRTGDEEESNSWSFRGLPAVDRVVLTRRISQLNPILFSSAIRTGVMEDPRSSR
jgi:hypothetical protein